MLRSEFFENQLRVDEKIKIKVVRPPLGTLFFKELAKTNRAYSISGDVVEFETQEVNKPLLTLAQ
ncbi:hypothetical protein [Mesonia sp. HuA40]|uniref:hypothetical protein n=1 Tax=Mesonia sp. HuA40 TaxID=2602761 RepID=UPI0011C9AAAB|nr:hypothetical protein [Mesonia sp. HuA40]TXK73922.1 hypothetical protein FT993_03425 [Mesonia sp. HuA40]